MGPILRRTSISNGRRSLHHRKIDHAEPLFITLFNGFTVALLEGFLPVPQDVTQAAPSWIHSGHALVHLPQPSDQRLHKLNGTFRIGLDGGDELVIGRHEAFGVGHRLNHGRSRPWLDQAHLAEHVTRVQGPDTPGLGTFAYAHLDRTCNYEKSGI